MRTTADVACLLLAFIAADVNAPIIYGAAGTRNVPELSAWAPFAAGLISIGLARRRDRRRCR